MSLRSPLGRVLGLGSARGGSSHWYAQRVTAVALVLLALWLVVSLASLADASYEQVTGWLRWPLNSALALLLVIVSAWHAVLGLQVVVEDYVADKGKRLLVLIAIKFAFVVAAVVGVLAVLRIAFGVAA
jgi:succinate dehydrogenase / fumarate reductase, membrane anchor subunit